MPALSSNPSTHRYYERSIVDSDALLFGGLFALLVNSSKSYVAVRFSCDVSVARSLASASAAPCRRLGPQARVVDDTVRILLEDSFFLCRRAKGQDIADRRQRLRKASFRSTSRVPRLPRGNARSRVGPRHRRRGGCCRLVVRVEIASSVGSPSMASSSCQRAMDPVPEPGIGSEGIYSLASAPRCLTQQHCPRIHVDRPRSSNGT
jgi:hypothetical protein